MASESNKRKSNSHTKETFYDLVEQIPFVGPPIYNLLKRKGGNMKKTGAYILIIFAVIALVIIFFVWLHYEHSNQQNTNSNNITDINGNNNALIQNSPNAILNYGISDEWLKQIREGMLAVQKQKEAELQAEFKMGYVIFTATERNEIVPLNSPMDEIITIDWKADYNVSFNEDSVILHIPNIILNPGQTKIENNVVMVPRNGQTKKLYKFGNYTLCVKALSAKSDSAMIVMGIKEDK